MRSSLFFLVVATLCSSRARADDDPYSRQLEQRQFENRLYEQQLHTQQLQQRQYEQAQYEQRRWRQDVERKEQEARDAEHRRQQEALRPPRPIAYGVVPRRTARSGTSRVTAPACRHATLDPISRGVPERIGVGEKAGRTFVVTVVRFGAAGDKGELTAVSRFDGRGRLLHELAPGKTTVTFVAADGTRWDAMPSEVDKLEVRPNPRLGSFLLESSRLFLRNAQGSCIYFDDFSVQSSWVR